MIQPAKKILAEPPQNMDHWLLLASGPPISFDSALNLCLGDQMSPMEDSVVVKFEILHLLEWPQACCQCALAYGTMAVWDRSTPGLALWQ